MTVTNHLAKIAEFNREQPFDAGQQLWLQEIGSKDGDGLIEVVETVQLGDNISTPGANEGDVVVRFKKAVGK